MKLFESMNEHAVPVAHYMCETCCTHFTVCPAPDRDDNWHNCLAEDCDSFDPSRVVWPGYLLN